MAQNEEMDISERCILEKSPQDIIREHLERYNFASTYVRDRNVLDAASGTGFGSSKLIDDGAKNVIGIDCSLTALDYSKKHFGSSIIEYIRGDVTKMPFSSNIFDVVISFETIEHVQEYQEYLDECHRVLKPGGVFICSTPNKKLWSPGKQPPNKYHIREFFRDDFLYILAKKFTNLTLYGQSKRPYAKERIIAYIGMLLRHFPWGDSICNIYHSDIELPSPCAKSNDTIYLLNQKFDGLIYIAAYFLVVAYKKE
jgi:ubiquinone/menaquinone biosynthesis C-methylase UbiE